MDEIDRLLTHLESSAKSPEASKAPAVSRSAQPDSPNLSIDTLLQSIEPHPAKQTAPTPQPQTTRSHPSSSEENLLEQVKQQYDQQDQAERQRQAQLQQQAERERQQQARQKQEKLAQLKQQRRAELEKKASVWLKRLDRKSSEGRWFEEFACSYASPLEAAIDYLEALEEVNPQP